MAVRPLNDFISTIKSSHLARQNRFTVTICNSPGSSSTLSMVELFCEQAVLPSISFSSQPVRTYGDQREVVYERNFESVTLTFLVDRQFYVKDYFDQWTSQIVDPATRQIGFYNEYVRDLEIRVQDTKDSDTYYVKLCEAYPKTISSITLDYNSKDIMKMQVTFNYKYHTNRQISSSASSVKDPKKIFGFDIPDPYKLSRSLGDYVRGSVPSMYIEDFKQYQQQYNDSTAVRNANSLLERQGIQIGSGLSAIDFR